MRKTILAVAFLIPSTLAAQEFNSAAVAVPSESLIASLNQVCNSETLVLSTEAKIACESQSYPRLVAAGNAFRNTGIGAEFNTLMRQVQ